MPTPLIVQEETRKRRGGLGASCEPSIRSSCAGTTTTYCLFCSPCTAATYCTLHAYGSAAFLTVSQGYQRGRSHFAVGDHFSLGLDPNSLLPSHLPFSDLLYLYLLRCWHRFESHPLVIVGYVCVKFIFLGCAFLRLAKVC